MVGASGLIRYSGVRKVEHYPDTALQVWPNPVTTVLFIQNSAGFSSLTMYDLAGNKNEVRQPHER
jgi:hypothetical protein